jgi:hypothetical protein
MLNFYIMVWKCECIHLSLPPLILVHSSTDKMCFANANHTRDVLLNMFGIKASVGLSRTPQTTHRCQTWKFSHLRIQWTKPYIKINHSFSRLSRSKRRLERSPTSCASSPEEGNSALAGAPICASPAFCIHLFRVPCIL